MDIVFIRGLPGAGKTTIAHMLEAETGAYVVHCDAFTKPKFGEEQEDVNISQVIIDEFFRLSDSKASLVIVEGLLHDPELLRALIDFASLNCRKVRWFRICRPIEELLKIEKSREGQGHRIKNTKQDLIALQEQLNACKLEQEKHIENLDAKNSAAQIIGLLR